MRGQNLILKHHNKISGFHIVLKRSVQLGRLGEHRRDLSASWFTVLNTAGTENIELARENGAFERRDDGLIHQSPKGRKVELLK